MKTPTKTTKTRQAILWSRFSSDQQKDGDSKDRQDRLNRALATRLGVEIVGDYFDPAASVKDGVTPLFKKVIADLPDGVGIICENLDRISRAHSWIAKALYYQLIMDGHFIITSQDGKEYNQDTIEELETMIVGDMSSAMARYENNKRTKRVREEKGKAVELARKGLAAPFGSWLPAHLKYNPESKTYDVIEERKKLIRDVFTWYANGDGVQVIAKRLNETKVPALRSKKVNPWCKSTIFGLLRYEGVIGVLNYKGERIANAWQPAIKEALFYKVQGMLEVNKAKHGNYKSERVNNILRGICKCKYCGQTMNVTWDNYLACSGRSVGKCAIKNMVPHYKELEYEFAKWFVPAARDALLGKNTDETTIETLTAKKNALDAKIASTVDLLDSGLAVLEVKARLTKLTIERDSIENEIASTKAKNVNTANVPESLKELDAFIEGIKDNQAIRKQVAAIMPTLVKRVDMDIKDRLWPIFTFHLVNGGEVTFNRELVITGANGVTVTINKDTIRSSDGKLNRKRILSKTA